MSTTTIGGNTMATASAWFALGGALGGVLISGAIALITAVLNHRWQSEAAQRNFDWEHSRQIRQERRETYAQYWTAWNALMRILERGRDNIESADLAAAEALWREALDAMFLICGSKVLEAGIEHIHLTEARIAARSTRAVDGAGKSRALNRAMREDILHGHRDRYPAELESRRP
ncbi:hypothetical protein [Nonomuraea indica]|uniref:hypothetical protein n=1 Tax=Nonomuraea indica TaxID=1581193 RepID=UPI0011844074|nr:hypothetical protein [Nonomuraea indica]